MHDPHVSLRRIYLALRGLPMGSWPDHEHAASWSITDHLLATLIDEVRQLAWITASANSKHKVQKPKPMDRPGQRRRDLAKAKAKSGGWVDFAKSLAGVND